MSTYIMASDISFPASRGRKAFGFRRVNSIHTEKSWKEFTGKAEITLPRNVKDFREIEASALFAIGDPVTVKFGYGTGELPTEFEGYVTDIADGVPYKLSIEDEMYMLKKGTVSVSARNMTLKKLLQTIAPGYKVECPDINLGTVRYTEVAPIAVLENLKKELNIYSYFAKKVLHAVDGNSQSDESITIVLERNAVSENLNRKKEVEEKIRVRFKSLQRTGKYITVEVGDEGGTVQVRNWPYLTKDEITIRAKRIIELQKSKGFDGTVTLFGIPRLEQGVVMDLSSIFYSNIKGKYFVDKVVKTFDKGGIRQQATLGNKAE